jgi:Zn-dependent protease
MIYTISIWLLPAIIAITFHEAAHAFVARARGDDTASRLGRVSLNPLKHIDPFGTILLPGILLLAHSSFLFGYAKPVPVNLRALHNPRLLRWDCFRISSRFRCRGWSVTAWRF